MRIVFMGTPEFSINVLQSLIDSEYDVVGVVTQPDKPVGRKQVLTPPAIKQLALQYDIPVFQPVDIRQDHEQVIKWQPDIIITCAYGQIIPKVLLDLPPLGAINVHASLLPKYRGGAPIQWSIINGETETGITIMYMAEKMDAGDMIVQAKIPIAQTDNYGTLHDKLSELGAKLLMETLPDIIAGTNKRIPQDESKVSYAWNIKKEDEKLNWQKPSQDIVNHIRGLNPFPGAYTLIDGTRFKIYEATSFDITHQNVPGTIIEITNDAVIVAAGEGAVKIIEGQLAGRKRQFVETILNGKHPFEKGKQFE